MREQSTTTAADLEPFVLFEIAGTTYGVRSRDVQQVQMVERVTPLPNSLDAIEGVVYSGGTVIPVMNLRARFSFERIPVDIRTRLVVVNVGSRAIGLLVDTARDFVRIDRESIAPTPEGITGLSAKYLEGIATHKGRMVLVLNLAKVIDIGEPQVLSEDVLNGVQNEKSGYQQER